MSKDQRGTKRFCNGCGKKFYDLGRDPIVCPLCDTAFVPEKPKPKLEAKRAVEEAAAKAKADKEKEEATRQPVAEKDDEPEFVSLEDAAAEEDSDDVDLGDLGDDDGEIPDEDEADVFLEDDEDDDGSDVSGIIGSPIDPKDEG